IMLEREHGPGPAEGQIPDFVDDHEAAEDEGAEPVAQAARPKTPYFATRMPRRFVADGSRSPSAKQGAILVEGRFLHGVRIEWLLLRCLGSCEQLDYQRPTAPSRQAAPSPTWFSQERERILASPATHKGPDQGPAPTK